MAYFLRPPLTRESIESYEQMPAQPRARCKFFHTDHGWTFLQESPKCFKILGLEAVSFARSVIQAGATSVAVISDLLAAGSPEARVRDYLTALR